MQERPDLWANTLTALASGVSLTVPILSTVPENAYLKQLKNIEESLWRGLDGPRQAIRHVHHDIDRTLETVVGCVHGLDVGAAHIP